MAINWKNTWRDIKKIGAKVLGGLAGIAAPIVSTVNPAAGAVLNGISNLASKDSAKAQQDEEAQRQADESQKNRDFQTQERLETQAYNEQQLKEQREYDSPTAQAERAQQAGVNMNSVFGQGTSYASSASPAYSQPMSGSTAQMASGLGNSMLTSDAQNMLAMSQAKLNDDTGNKVKSETALNLWNLNFSQRTEEERIKAFSLANDEYSARIREIETGIENVHFDWQMREKMYEQYASMSDAQRDEIRAKITQISNQCAVLEQQKELLKKQQKTEEATADKLIQDTRVAEEQEQLVRNEAAKVGYEIANEIKEGKLKDEELTQEQIETALLALQMAFSEAIGVPVNAPEYQFQWNIAKNGNFWNYVELLCHRANIAIVDAAGTAAGTVAGSAVGAAGGNKGKSSKPVAQKPVTSRGRGSTLGTNNPSYKSTQ